MADQCENKWHLNIGLTEKKERNESLSLLKHMKFDEIRNHSQRSQIKPIKSLKFKSKGFPKKKKANENETRTQEWGMSKMGRKWDENGTLRTTKIKWMKKKTHRKAFRIHFIWRRQVVGNCGRFFFSVFFLLSQSENERPTAAAPFFSYLFIYFLDFIRFFLSLRFFIFVDFHVTPWPAPGHLTKGKSVKERKKRKKEKKLDIIRVIITFYLLPFLFDNFIQGRNLRIERTEEYHLGELDHNYSLFIRIQFENDRIPQWMIGFERQSPKEGLHHSTRWEALRKKKEEDEMIAFKFPLNSLCDARGGQDWRRQLVGPGRSQWRWIRHTPTALFPSGAIFSFFFPIFFSLLPTHPTRTLSPTSPSFFFLLHALLDAALAERQFYRVLPSFTEFSTFHGELLLLIFSQIWNKWKETKKRWIMALVRLEPSFTEFYRVLPSFTEFYRVFSVPRWVASFDLFSDVK